MKKIKTETIRLHNCIETSESLPETENFKDHIIISMININGVSALFGAMGAREANESQLNFEF